MLFLLVGRICLRILPFKTMNHYLQKLEVRAKRVEQANDRYQDEQEIEEYAILSEKEGTSL